MFLVTLVLPLVPSIEIGFETSDFGSGFRISVFGSRVHGYDSDCFGNPPQTWFEVGIHSGIHAGVSKGVGTPGLSIFRIFGFQVSDFVIRVSGVGSRVSGFEFRVLGFR